MKKQLELLHHILSIRQAIGNIREPSRTSNTQDTSENLKKASDKLDEHILAIVNAIQIETE